MATIRLIPSTIYNAAGTSYVQITNESNAYTNTDSTTYATIYNRNASTSSRYVYIRGFNFDDIPSAAVVTSFTIKMKGYESGISTSTSYQPYLANGTSAINGSCSPFTTSTTTRTFSGVTADWETIKGYGDNFGIRLNCRRASRNTTGYVYLYGAEIEVEYTVPNPRTITTTLSGNGTIEPSGTNTYYDGDNFELIITPTNSSDTVTATLNGTNITSQLEHHTGSEIESQVPTEDFTTGFSSSSAAFYQNSSTSSTSWLEYAIGHSAESPYSTSNTNNTYVKPEGATGWINYQFDFSAIPTSATITNVSVKVYGAREDATVDSSHVARFQCYSGSTAKGTIQNFTSTSNSLVTVSDVGTWTAAELHNAQLRFEVGYYGGRMLGITWSVTYTAKDHYTYTYTVSGNATIAVTIGSSGSQSKVFIKQNGSWVQCSKIYKKVNGSWVEQSSSAWDSIFDTNVTYRIMN